MTAHPIDTEALRQDVDFAQRLTGTYQADSTRGYYPAMERIFEAVPALLDALAAAEHRATRAEAQSAVRSRAAVIYRERAREAEAQIKAVRGVHRKWTIGDPCDKRRGCGGADCAPHVNGHGDKVWRHWRDDCTGCAATWPCPTIHALDGDA